MVLAIEGHGAFMASLPSAGSIFFCFISLPFSSIKIGWTPGKGKVAKVGRVGVIPAIGEIIIAPVSVCHQVSTMGQLVFPILSLYQCQASSLMGSPTDPSTFKLERSCFSTRLKGCFANALIAVGAV